MPNQGDIHVVPAEQGWRIEIEGAGVRSAHRTQSEGTRVARDIARANKCELLVHGRNGRIRERNSYGHDPRRFPGYGFCRPLTSDGCVACLRPTVRWELSVGCA